MCSSFWNCDWNASPHTMKDATGVPPERLCIYVSRAWRKSKVLQQEGALRNDIRYLTNRAGGTQAFPLTLFDTTACPFVEMAHWLTATFFISLPFSFYNILIFILPSFWIIPLFQCIHVDVNTYVRVLMCTCVHEYTLKSHTIMRVAFYQHNEEILIMLRPTP